MAASHDCVERINEMLKDRNTRLAYAVSLVPDTELIPIVTVKLDSKKKGSAVTMFASFCPFCGKPLKVK